MKKNIANLSAEQHRVTQENGTELPYENEYWDFFEKGIYTDIVSGEVLFSSLHKFKSMCGWPSFFKALDINNIQKIEDQSHGMRRVEVRSKNADSHLGHIFTDGPAPSGVRYCINSAALNFIPYEKLEVEGYSEWIKSFDNSEKTIDKSNLEYAYLGAGCFWGVEVIFAKIEGVDDVISGYSGGGLANPRYEDICRGDSGHAEVVKIVFDPKIINYEKLLSYFWRLHDPTTLNRQGYDNGTQYRSVIYFVNEEQEKIAISSKTKLNQSSKWKDSIVTEISPLSDFYEAEEHHQDYYHKKYQGGTGPICHFLRDE